MTEKKKSPPDRSKPVTLKILAEYLDLSPATVSIVLNNSPVAKSISQATHQRVQAAFRLNQLSVEREPGPQAMMPRAIAAQVR